MYEALLSLDERERERGSELWAVLLVKIVGIAYCIYTFLAPCRTLIAILFLLCAHQVYLHFGSQQTSFDFVAETFAVWLMVSSERKHLPPPVGSGPRKNQFGQFALCLTCAPSAFPMAQRVL